MFSEKSPIDKRVKSFQSSLSLGIVDQIVNIDNCSKLGSFAIN